MLSNSPVSVVLPVVDLKRARKFYEEVLGLKVKEVEATGEVLYEAGGSTMLLIYQRPAVKVEHTQASFYVQDLGAEMAELRGKGLVFEEYDFPGLKTANGVATLGTYRAAWFKDTEGNILSLGQKA